MSRQAPLRVFAACLLSIFLGTSSLAQTPPPKPPARPQATAKPAVPAVKTPPAKAAPAAGPVKATPAPEPPASDVKIHTRYTRGAEVSENTTYIHGPRQRVEFPGIVTLDQCDLSRTVLLNGASKKYLIRPYPAEAPAAVAPPPSTDMEAMAAMGMMGRGGQPQPKGGVITYTATLTDTLERKPLFGKDARRIRTVIVKQPSASACDKTGLKIEVDGWYVDLPESAGCTKRSAAPEVPAAPSTDACVDRVESRSVGDAKLGFPVAMVTTTTTGDGDKKETSSTSMEVTDLAVTRLPAALFGVPPDFVEANSSAELLPTLAAGGSLTETLFGSTADGTSSAAPKRPGIIRVGVLEPTNQTSHAIAARQLREHLVGEFHKAPFEALALAGTAAGDSQQDAARFGCDYILFTEVTDIRTSKPGRVTGLLKRTAGEDATRDIHEVKLDYKLYAVGGTATTVATGSSKASSGGIGVSTGLKLAAVAGRMYLSMYGMGGLGMGMMNPLMSIPGLSGAAGSFAASGLFDPRMKAMSSMTQIVSTVGMNGLGAMAGAPGGDDDSEAALTQTVGAALDRAAKTTMEQLQSRKK
ncbi:MAG: hypothetical protein NTV05_04400 [Acidobacteria bacterium]|nr:hypothetical protein [Acidobacteriota bacterium]